MEEIDENLNLFCATNNVQYIHNIDRKLKNFLIEMAKQSRDIYKSVVKNGSSDDGNISYIYYKRATDILDTYTNYVSHGSTEECNNVKGLYNIANSCYLDSVIMALFLVPQPFMDNLLQSETEINDHKFCSDDINEDIAIKSSIQNAIYEIVQSIRGKSDKAIKYCTNLRKLFATCKSMSAEGLDFSSGETNDASEYLDRMMSLFDYKGKLVTRITTHFTDDIGDVNDQNFYTIKTTITDNISYSIIWSVQHTYIEEKVKQFGSKTPLDIRMFLNLTDDEKDLQDTFYKRKINSMEVIDTPYLVINFQRKHRATILPVKTITLPSKRKFNLSAIVMRRGGHYTALIRCGMFWYYYNDIGARFIKVSNIFRMSDEEKNDNKLDYKNMLRLSGKYMNPMENGTLFFYVPIN